MEWTNLRWLICCLEAEGRMRKSQELYLAYKHVDSSQISAFHSQGQSEETKKHKNGLPRTRCDPWAKNSQEEPRSPPPLPPSSPTSSRCLDHLHFPQPVVLPICKTKTANCFVWSASSTPGVHLPRKNITNEQLHGYSTALIRHWESKTFPQIWRRLGKYSFKYWSTGLFVPLSSLVSSLSKGEC